MDCILGLHSCYTSPGYRSEVPDQEWLSTLDIMYSYCSYFLMVLLNVPPMEPEQSDNQDRT